MATAAAVTATERAVTADNGGDSDPVMGWAGMGQGKMRWEGEGRDGMDGMGWDGVIWGWE